ncbi:UDP-glucose 4-epimerase family protein [Ferrovibrio xuzhouensis]|uniref:UDP-glucose 4-epimerase family protein n=1 Tax=Ferrovibrio xuzhouensis TaxID=1576914 RepID=A0ABV7VM30_9PROT
MKVLVTGASGFVGRELCACLERSGHTVIRAMRRPGPAIGVVIGNIDGGTSWAAALSDAPDAVLHLAARVHVMGAEGTDAARLYRQVNSEGTTNLARQSAAAGVKRFVFLSTIKVLGEGGNRPYKADDPAAPCGPYAVSKWQAEQGLLEIAGRTGMEAVILRPPLVYGPGVGANFLRLMQAVDAGWPLPFAAIRNRRSLIHVGNLVDAIVACLTQAKAAGKTFMVSDDEDVSTPELVRRIASSLGRRPRLFPVPPAGFRLCGQLLGKGAAIERLLGSLTADCAPIRTELGWAPPHTMQDGLAIAAEWYRKIKASS